MFAILSVKYLNKIKRKFVRTIIRVPDDLWNEITNIYKMRNQRIPQIDQLFHIDKYLTEYSMSWELDVNGNCYLKTMVLVLDAIEVSRNGCN